MSTCINYNLSACSRKKCSSGSQLITVNNTCVCSRGRNTVYSGPNSGNCGNPSILNGTYHAKKRNMKKVCCGTGYTAKFGKNPYCFGCLRNQPSVRCSRFGCFRVTDNSRVLNRRAPGILAGRIGRGGR